MCDQGGALHRKEQIELISAIYLCGPIADVGKPAKGGYQSRNRRVIEALRTRGIEVHELPYAQPESSGIRKVIEYGVNFSYLAVKVIFCKRKSILHITGLRRIFLYPELLLIYLGKLKGCRTIYDVRDGLGLDLAYLERSKLYKRCFTLALRSVDRVMVQGETQAPFIESMSGRTPVLVPNQVDISAVPHRAQPNAKPLNPIIAYAGALRTEKGISTILEATRLLKNGGVDATVLIAGSGDTDYVESLQKSYPGLNVDWLGAQTSDAVMELFSTSHFFMFPTWWPGEGQSNALTEAMACGCVPLVSDHGFNAATVGDCGAVLIPEDGAPQYAAALRSIWDSDQWNELSQKSIMRVRDRFSSDAVIDILVAQYVSLQRATESVSGHGALT